ncbi:hypothetical protein [Chryseobacterium sp.]
MSVCRKIVVMKGTKMPGVTIDLYQTEGGEFNFEVLEDTNNYFFHNT